MFITACSPAEEEESLYAVQQEDATGNHIHLSVSHCSENQPLNPFFGVFMRTRVVLSPISLFYPILRCGGMFCAVHRYAESHACTFDYKAEGRQIIARNNPVVTAHKLPKI